MQTRRTTSQPLVEQLVNADGSIGAYVPTGRQFSDTPRTDGRNSYGLTELENVAFQTACDLDRGTPPQNYTDANLGRAMAAAGLTALSPLKERAAFVVQFRKEHPFPTKYASLPKGDPSFFAEPKHARHKPHGAVDHSSNA